MNRARRRLLLAALGVVVAAGLATWFTRDPHHYLDGDTTAFVNSFAPPPERGSAQERAELDELLALQRSRSPEAVAAAVADRKTRIGRFALALGTDESTLDSLPRVQALAQVVEDDIRPYVRAAKERFRRLRPREVEPAMEPCIGDVAADLSYPSGHATFGYVMALVLSDLVPERSAALMARGVEFAHQRMVCGVHFPSDLEAGKKGARLLVDQLHESADYRRDAAAAAQELRAALKLSSAR